MYEGPGIYRHYKGGYYRVLGVAKGESDEKLHVIYHSYDIEHDLGRWMAGANFVARPLYQDDGPDCFNSEVTVEGKSVPRFQKIVK